MLVRITPESLDILRTSTYSEMVWEQKQKRFMTVVLLIGGFKETG